MTCGISYKFTLLKNTIIGTLWESCNYFPLALQTLIKLMALRIRHISIPQAEISKLPQVEVQPTK